MSRIGEIMGMFWVLMSELQSALLSVLHWDVLGHVSVWRIAVVGGSRGRRWDLVEVQGIGLSWREP